MEGSGQERWLAHLSASGDRAASVVHGYDRLAVDWQLAFPDGLPEHLIYLFVAGSVVGTVQDRAVRLPAGSFMWLAPRTPFRLHATGDVAPMLYRFRLATNEPPPVRSVVLTDAWELRATMDALVGELSGALPWRDERLRALFVVLFSAVFRAAGVRRAPAPLPAATRERLENYVDGRPAARPSVGELAAVAGLSVDYFGRRFRETFGAAPRTWLIRRRIQHAMLRLDESDETISELARRLGYPDVFLFSRQFKAITGVSPRSWRNRAAGRS
ncbi:MAG TPA: AraC family transcriptional regulator [Mycobacteriales bacterium]|nr:AraC family transcriptional regulator [Mycobacteriales bacterium]